MRLRGVRGLGLVVLVVACSAGDGDSASGGRGGGGVGGDGANGGGTSSAPSGIGGGGSGASGGATTVGSGGSSSSSSSGGAGSGAAGAAPNVLIQTNFESCGSWDASDTQLDSMCAIGDGIKGSDNYSVNGQYSKVVVNDTNCRKADGSPGGNCFRYLYGDGVNSGSSGVVLDFSTAAGGGQPRFFWSMRFKIPSINGWRNDAGNSQANPSWFKVGDVNNLGSPRVVWGWDGAGSCAAVVAPSPQVNYGAGCDGTRWEHLQRDVWHCWAGYAETGHASNTNKGAIHTWIDKTAGGAMTQIGNYVHPAELSAGTNLWQYIYFLNNHANADLDGKPSSNTGIGYLYIDDIRTLDAAPATIDCEL